MSARKPKPYVVRLEPGTDQYFVYAPDGDPVLASADRQRMLSRAEQLNDCHALAVKLERRRVRAKARKAGRR